MKASYFVIAGAFAMSTLAASLAFAGAAPSPISSAAAKARNANTITRDRCMSLCGSASTCASSCSVGKCYANPNTGNAYCVQ